MSIILFEVSIPLNEMECLVAMVTCVGIRYMSMENCQIEF